MTHGDKAIVHIPGELSPAGVQRCVRCHAKLGTYKGDSLGWRVGEPIISDRNGKSASNAVEAAKYRPCGGSKGSAQKSAKG